MENIDTTLAELRKVAAAELVEYNRILNKPAEGDNLADAEAKVVKALLAYNNESKKLVYTALKATKKPMLSAIEKLEIDTISKKAQKNTATGIVKFVIDDGTKQIRLSEFDDFCDSNACANIEWSRFLKEFCLTVTYKTCLDLGEKMDVVRKRLEETHYITHVAKDILGGKTPLSQTQMISRLQKLADAVVGGDVLKITKYDLEYVYTLMNKRGGCGNIVAPTHQTLEVLLMDVLHMTTQKKSYTVGYKQRKLAAASPTIQPDDDITTEILAA